MSTVPIRGSMVVDKDIIVPRAEKFARFQHCGQLRKYTKEPYWHHCRNVAQLVSEVTDDPNIIAAAWLHDVVEDTPVSHTAIYWLFGPNIQRLVEELTDVSRPQDGNRATRKAIDREHLSKASDAAKTIKLADLIDNTKSIVEHDPGFARVYLQEKSLLLPELLGGDPTLIELASMIYRDAIRKLGVPL